MSFYSVDPSRRSFSSEVVFQPNRGRFCERLRGKSVREGAALFGISGATMTRTEKGDFGTKAFGVFLIGDRSESNGNWRRVRRLSFGEFEVFLMKPITQRRKQRRPCLAAKAQRRSKAPPQPPPSPTTSSATGLEGIAEAILEVAGAGQKKKKFGEEDA
ncbi:hypothetical protein U1Q18_006011 [Sarracenia purpurea var. burkii]